jgi:hypothetical protein
MITTRHSSERGHANHGWLEARHTFSFADYDDPSHVSFRSLRVINEDRVAPGRGFGAHPHRDMEIITYVLEGAIEHQDNTGGRGIIRNGLVQRMSAGSGVVHSEKNASMTEPVHLLQIWIMPNRRGVPPRYEDREFPAAGRENRLQLMVSPDAADGSLDIHQDARMYASNLAAGGTLTHELAAGRHAWIQVASGKVLVNGVSLSAGDGAAVSDESKLTIAGVETSEFLLFDLA